MTNEEWYKQAAEAMWSGIRVDTYTPAVPRGYLLTTITLTHVKSGLWVRGNTRDTGGMKHELRRKLWLDLMEKVQKSNNSLAFPPGHDRVEGRADV